MLIKCRSSVNRGVNWMSMEVLIECQLSIDQGYRWRVSINTRLWMSLVHMIRLPVWIWHFYSFFTGNKNFQTSFFILSHDKEQPSIISLKINQEIVKWHSTYTVYCSSTCSYVKSRQKEIQERDYIMLAEVDPYTDPQGARGKAKGRKVHTLVETHNSQVGQWKQPHVSRETNRIKLKSIKLKLASICTTQNCYLPNYLLLSLMQPRAFLFTTSFHLTF